MPCNRLRRWYSSMVRHCTLGTVAVLVLHKADRRHERLDHMDLLQRRDNEQLQAQLAKQGQCEAGRFIGRSQPASVAAQSSR